MLVLSALLCCTLLDAPAPLPADGPPRLTLHEAERRAGIGVPQDTVEPPRRRRRVPTVEYSEGYGQRLTWHRRLSYAIVPLFAAQWYLGEQLMDNQQGPQWIGTSHRAIATATAGIYTFNTVTGLWNLWEGRHDPSGRWRKWIHAAAFTVADAGFIYGATLADDAQRLGQTYRTRHRTVELTSMGISLASWAAMLFLKD